MISYAITACNEEKELRQLIEQLSLFKHEEDEIVLQLDTTATKEVKEYAMSLNNITLTEFPLNNHFANFKNNLRKFCTKEWIFQIDADETLNPTLYEYLSPILLLNQDKDVILVPRVNTVVGMTPSDVRTYGWNINEKGWVNFPDFQWRLYKNNPNIMWVGAVHEQISGFKNMSRLPASEEYCLIHEKTIEKQRKQNEFYISTFNK